MVLCEYLFYRSKIRDLESLSTLRAKDVNHDLALYPKHDNKLLEDREGLKNIKISPWRSVNIMSHTFKFNLYVMP